MRRLLCWAMLLFAVGLRADWQAFLRDEVERTKKDDRGFVTLDRALKAEHEASAEDRPYLFLYATRKLQMEQWFPLYCDAAEPLPDLTKPSQSWTREQRAALLSARLKELGKYADLYAKVPAMPFFAALRERKQIPWPNASALTVVQTLAEGVSHEVRTELSESILAAARKAGDAMQEGMWRLMTIKDIPEAQQMAALKALERERAWPGDVQAGIWLEQARLLEQSAKASDTQTLQEAVRLLTDARDAATLHDLKVRAQERLNGIRRAEVSLENLPRVVPPNEPFRVTLRHRNARAMTVTFSGAYSGKPLTLTFANTAPYVWNEREVELPALPPGKTSMVFTLENNFEDLPKISHRQEVHACSFTVAAIGWQSAPDPKANDRRWELPQAYFVADIRTGAPLSGAEVTQYIHSFGSTPRARWSATTDALGLAHVSIPPLEDAAKYSDGLKVSVTIDGVPISSQEDETEVFLQSLHLRVTARGETLEIPLEMVISPAWRSPSEMKGGHCRVLTDRALYRPGDTVHFQLIYLAKDSVGSLRPVPKAQGELTFMGWDMKGERTFQTKTITLSDYGSYAGGWRLPKDFSGSCLFRLKVDNQELQGGRFSVSEFKAPSFAVTVEREKRGTPTSEPIHYKGTAIDLSGVPLAGAAVTWCVESEEGKVTGVATVGADGAFAFAAQLPKAKTTVEGRWISATAQVLNANGERQEASCSDYVPRWGYDFKAKLPKWQMGGEPFEVTLESERSVGGTLMAKQAGKTNAVVCVAFDKPGPVRLTLPAGSHDLTAISGPVTNALGRVIVFPRDGRLTEPLDALVRVRQEPPFEVGQTVELFAGIRGEGPAFLMVSTRHGVERILPLASPFHSLTIEEGLREGFALTVYGFHKGRFLSETNTYTVKPPEELKVEAVRFAPTARPGSAQTWEIAVDDPAAELVVTCYDKALDALQESTWSPFAPPYRYWGTWNLARALLSPSTLWLQENLPRDFCSDENIWDVSINVFEFCDDASVTAEAIFDVDAPAATSHVMMKSAVVMENVMGSRTPGTRGAALGRFDSGKRSESRPSVRTNFARTAFWAAQKRLEKGKAVFTFTLPDSLTTWKLMAFAYTPDGRSGTLVRDCVARLDVMLKPYLPRTLRVGDRLTLEVLLTNTTDRPLTTWAELNRANRRPVVLPAKGSATVSWVVAAQSVPGTQVFEFATEGDAVRLEVPVLDDRVTVEDVYPVTLVDTKPSTVAVAEPVPLLDLSQRWEHTPARAVAEALNALLRQPEMGCDDAFARLGALALLRRMNAAPEGADVREEALLNRLLAQRTEGLWAWFPEGAGDGYVSAEICVGVARLHRLGLAPKPLVEAVRETLTQAGNRLPFAVWAYVRGAFAKEWPLAEDVSDRLFRAYREADSVQERRMLTLAAHRLGVGKVAEAGLKDVLDAMNTSEAWGAWWPQERTWWNRWQTPIESHALGLEVLQAFGKDAEAKAAARWLLQHRRLNDWGTPRATLAAAFALCAEPSGWDTTPAKAADVRVTSRRAEGGARREVTLARTEPGLSFGRLVATYRLPLDRVPPPIVDDTAALTLTRTLTPECPNVGDTVTVTLTLTAAQPMSHVRVRDERPANTEPVRALPWWDFGSGAYVRPGDTGIDCFLPELPRGVTTLRYQLKATHAGACRPGLATAAPVVAPDFAARTDAQPFTAKPRP